MKTNWKTNGEFLGANNREKMWEQFPDTFVETLLDFFKILKLDISKSWEITFFKSWKS